jgi:nucleotide-binding universal stress UspA family protein
MFERVLVAVDGSQAAERALKLACDLAGRCGSAVTLIHVRGRSHARTVSPDLRAYAESEHLDITTDELVRVEGERILTDARSQAAELGVRASDVALMVGDPSTCIVEQAREHRNDLIVMGQRGLGSLGALLMGSVSHKVTQLAPCACLVVK